MTTSHCVSLIAPCRNERAHIEAFCRDALAQQLPAGWRLELCVADGRSDDGTREWLEAQVAQDARLRWIDNPARIVSAGLNRALAATEGEVVVRMDIHTRYAANYVARCLQVLANSNADNVGGPWCAEAGADAGTMERAVVAAFQSSWVAGGARSRQLDYAGWVDTVYLGCWPRKTFERFGTFDEALVRNQDDEHNLRIRSEGGRIWQSPTIRSFYRPRGELRQVARQWFQYGYWKPFVMVKHGQAASARHVVPGAFVAGLLLALPLALVGWYGPLLALVTAYGIVLAGLGLNVAREARLPRPVAWRVPGVIAAYHLGYGLGSLPGWWDALRGRPGRFAALTR